MSSRGKKKRINNQQKVVRIKLNPEELPQVSCEKCQSIVFGKGFSRRVVSQFQSPNGQVGFFDVPVVYCLMCGTPLDEKKALGIKPPSPIITEG